MKIRILKKNGRSGLSLVSDVLTADGQTNGPVFIYGSIQIIPAHFVLNDKCKKLAILRTFDGIKQFDCNV